MDFLTAIGNFIKGLFTAEQWLKITNSFINAGGIIAESTGEVLLLVLLTVICTQILKIVWQRSPLPGPPEYIVHLSALGFCGLWSWRLLDGVDSDVRAALAVIAWGGVWLIATVGIGTILATIWPRGFRAWQGDRRHAQIANSPARRKEDQAAK